MNNTTEVSILIRGEVLDSMVCRSLIEAERYKTAVRNWAREEGLVVTVMARVIAAQDQRDWLIAAQAS